MKAMTGLVPQLRFFAPPSYHLLLHRSALPPLAHRPFRPSFLPAIASSCSHNNNNNSNKQHIMDMSTTPDGRLHIVDAILDDHKEIKAYFQQYKDSKTMDDKVKWSNQWRWEVARHSIGEELVAYPAMESYIFGGLAMADKDRAQHLVVKQNLSQLQNMEPWREEPTFDQLMHKTQQALENHMKEEEDDDLPKLRNAIPHEEGLRLGHKFQLTKHFVPTRSHPSAPDKPPFETVVGFITAPLDKLRDMFDKFPSKEELSYAKANQ